MRWSLFCTTRQSWSELLRRAQLAEQAGLSGVWVPDHLMSPREGYRATGDAGSDGDLAPVLETWTVLAALAVSVPRVRLGALVSPTTHRHPATVAKMATTVDQMSGGRAVLGLGAGWQVDEHAAYGLDLPPVAERLDRLEEACRVVRSLLREQRSEFAGEHFALDRAPLAPKPTGELPLLVGGGGERRTLRIAAAHADEWNVWATPEVAAEKAGVLARHCEAIGRDPLEVTRSANVLVHLDGSDPPQLDRPVVTVEQLTMAEQAYAAVGVTELVVADFNHPDPAAATEVIDAIGERADH